ncbi:MAG: hypothetical protein ABL866_12325 [Devosia sp.]
MPVKTFETDKFGEPTGKTFGQWLKFAEREKLSTLPRDQIAAGFSKAACLNSADAIERWKAFWKSELRRVS